MAENMKLTVRVDKRWIEPAKRYAAQYSTTLSKMISEYLRAVATQDQAFDETPILRRLTGVLPNDISTAEYDDYLEEKYGG
ncbi:MAG: hypothetical protein FJ010_01820 [Chloroflexi bacterium]|nr:hypothetical protein [Chloroflexota bacterium]